MERVYHAMREVLAEAIESRGSSVSNYVDAEGRKGSFQLAHRVYRRTGRTLRQLRRGDQADRGRAARDAFLSEMPAVICFRRCPNESSLSGAASAG